MTDTLPSVQPPVTLALAGLDVLPQLITRAGRKAEKRFLEFFVAIIRNPNTRTAYARAVGRFFQWCSARGLTRLDQVEPMVVAAYVEQLGRERSKPTVKQHLAAVRMLFDWLVTGGVLPMNPASSVRGPKHVVGMPLGHRHN